MTKAKEMRELTSGIDVDANGNVGIGTDNPSELLHANGSIRLTTDVSTTRRLYALSGTGPYALNSSGGAAIAFHRDATNNDEIAFETHWQGNQHAERMRIDNQGNVGIGTSTPDTILEIVSSNPILTLRDTGSGFNNGDATLRLAESGPGDTLGGYFDVRLDASMLKFDFTPEGGSVSTYMAINSSDGNVGIGETDPAGKLEVQNTSVNYAILGTSNNGHYFESQSDDNTDGFEIYQQHGSTTTRNSFIVNDNRTGSKSAALVVRGDGNVGIGTASPVSKLDIRGGVVNVGYDSTGGVTYVQKTFSTIHDAGNRTGDIAFGLVDGSFGGMIARNVQGGNASFNSQHLEFHTHNGGINAGERMRIDYTGNVGIGTSSPQRKIHSVDSNGQVLRLQRDGAFTGSWDLSIGTQTTGDFTVYDNENSQRAITVEKLTGFSGTSAMYIDSSGRTLLRTSSVFDNAYTLQVQVIGSTGGIIIEPEANNYTAMRFNNASGTQVGDIVGGASSTSYNTTSDYRLKENVTDVTDGITRVKQLEPKRFNFIADPDKTVDGFLAHEAQAVVPEAVTGTHNEVDDNGNAVMQGIDQSKLVPLLTAALQEAIAKIEALEARVTALES